MGKFKISILERENIKDYKKWQTLLNSADGATIFHNLDFLSYHKDRFQENHIGVFKGEELFGVMPLAISNKEKKVAKSPYGASYGGFIFKNNLTYSSSKEIAKLIKEFLKQNNISSMVITPPLEIYYKNSSQTFNFALLESGFKIVNADITSVVPLSNNIDLEKSIFTSKLRNILRKAEKNGIEIINRASIDDFWILMEDTFNRHGVLPTHTKDELIYLNQKFPDKIYFNVAYINKIPVAGICIFTINSLVDMSFYLCSNSKYKQTQALSLLVANTIKESQKKGFRYFDFGTSSVNMIGKENIFKFKESFGAIGKFRFTYRL
jgi:lipid II:glycine glycyltransferase (peptidoglycan interpeptide bridge formation enzyme)